MKNYLIYILLLTTLFSCVNKKPEQNKLIGEITNYDSSKKINNFYLYKLSEKGFKAIDTASISENGKFMFNLPKTLIGLYTIGLTPQNAITIYLDSNTKEQKIIIKDLTRISKGYEAKGNKVSEEIANFTVEVNKMISLGSMLNKKAKKLEFNDTVELKKLYEEFQLNSEIFVEKRNTFINKNITSPALVVVLDQIDPKQEFDLFKEVVLDGLGRTIPNSIYYKGVKTYINQIEKQKIDEEKKKNFLKTGTPAPELNFPGVNGSNIALSSLRGKVVLLDFWASWCRPCRIENPNVVKLYNKYNKKGFEVFSFSLDQDKNKWLKAIEKDGLIWKSHVSDLKGWQTASIPIYGYNSIPFTVLIDKKGNIIAKNLKGKALENKLAELFN